MRLAGARTRARAHALVALGAALSIAAGCAGVFGFDGTSDSAGWHAQGTLRHPAVLPVEGDGYVIPGPWRLRQSRFGSDELVGLVVRASREVAEVHPGSVAAVGDLSRRSGGESVEHKSHQSGRDVDIFYYGVDASGRAELPRGTMLHFDRAGRAVRWSPPQGSLAPSSPVPPVRFDPRRNWSLVRALLRDPDVEVQWIFVQRDLAALLIQEGVAEGDDPALLARASQIVRQPSDSEPHDDHMHIRIYCDPSDRVLGCSDRGPMRWWKKRWKYMAPPFDHPETPPDRDLDGRKSPSRSPTYPRRVDTIQALFELLRGREPLAPAARGMTS